MLKQKQKEILLKKISVDKLDFYYHSGVFNALKEAVWTLLRDDALS